MCNFLPCHPLYRSFSRLQVTVHGGYGSVEQIFLSILFFKKNLDSVQNEFGLVQFEKCGSVRILWLFTTCMKVKWIYTAPSRETSKSLRNGSHSFTCKCLPLSRKCSPDGATTDW